MTAGACPYTLYSQLQVPVVPVALNSGLFWGRRTFVKRPGRITLAFLDPIPPGMDRKVFRRTLQDRIEEASNRLAAEAGAPPRAPASERRSDMVS